MLLEAWMCPDANGSCQKGTVQFKHPALLVKCWDPLAAKRMIKVYGKHKHQHLSPVKANKEKRKLKFCKDSCSDGLSLVCTLG